MFKKYTGLLLAGFVLTATARAANDNAYPLEVSVGGGIANLAPDLRRPLRVSDDNDTTAVLTFGKSITKALQFQFRYADFGEVAIDPGGSIRYDAFAMALQYELPVLTESPFSVNALAGGAATDASATLLSLEESNSEVMLLGASLDFAMTEDWRVRLEGATYGEGITAYTLGVATRF